MGGNALQELVREGEREMDRGKKTCSAHCKKNDSRNDLLLLPLLHTIPYNTQTADTHTHRKLPQPIHICHNKLQIGTSHRYKLLCCNGFGSSSSSDDSISSRDEQSCVDTPIISTTTTVVEMMAVVIAAAMTIF